MGIASSKNNSESLNWDKINTESMSTTLPNVARITQDAEQLISRLDTNKQILLEDTESENENLFTWLKTIGDDNSNKKNDTEASFSDTSAFISSDMYKYLMNNNEGNTTSTHIGQVGGNVDGDSSTSSTSSSPRKNKKSKKSKKSRKHNKYVESSSVMSGGDLSYLSSSAHTENNQNKSQSEIKHYTSSPDSIQESSVSARNNRMLTSSINTSDINLISPDTN